MVLIPLLWEIVLLKKKLHWLLTILRFIVLGFITSHVVFRGLFLTSWVTVLL